MQRRPLGTTGLTVTEMGLGLAALGRPGYFNLGHADDVGEAKGFDAMRSRAHQVLDLAYAGGIRYFDAARSYGLAEAMLGLWLDRRRPDPDEVTIGSKWGYRYTAAWRADAEVHEVKDHSVGAFSEQLAESRFLLGRWLDLYQLHSAVLETGVLDDKDLLTALVKLGEEGIVVGLSVSGANQPAVVRRALEAEVDGINPFECVQATWNVLEPSAATALAEAADAGWGVIVKEAVANGRLTDRNREPGFEPARAVLERVTARHEVAVDAVALAAALHQPWVSVVLSGAAAPDQLESNLAATEVRLDDDDLDGLLALAEEPETYWSIRAALPWT